MQGTYHYVRDSTAARASYNTCADLFVEPMNLYHRANDDQDQIQYCTAQQHSSTAQHTGVVVSRCAAPGAANVWHVLCPVELVGICMCALRVVHAAMYAPSHSHCMWCGHGWADSPSRPSTTSCTRGDSTESASFLRHPVSSCVPAPPLSSVTTYDGSTFGGTTTGVGSEGAASQSQIKRQRNSTPRSRLVTSWKLRMSWMPGCPAGSRSNAIWCIGSCVLHQSWLLSRV